MYTMEIILEEQRMDSHCNCMPMESITMDSSKKICIMVRVSISGINLNTTSAILIQAIKFGAGSKERLGIKGVLKEISVMDKGRAGILLVKFIQGTGKMVNVMARGL